MFLNNRRIERYTSSPRNKAKYGLHFRVIILLRPRLLYVEYVGVLIGHEAQYFLVQLAGIPCVVFEPFIEARHVPEVARLGFYFAQDCPAVRHVALAPRERVMQHHALGHRLFAGNDAKTGQIAKQAHFVGLGEIIHVVILFQIFDLLGGQFLVAFRQHIDFYNVVVQPELKV